MRLFKKPAVCVVGYSFFFFLALRYEDAPILWTTMVVLDLHSLRPLAVSSHVDSEVIKLEVDGFRTGRR